MDEDIGKKLKKFREEGKFGADRTTRRALAESVSFGATWLERIENKGETPRPEYLDELASLSVDPAVRSYLFEQSGLKRKILDAGDSADSYKMGTGELSDTDRTLLNTVEDIFRSEPEFDGTKMALRTNILDFSRHIASERALRDLKRKVEQLTLEVEKLKKPELEEAGKKETGDDQETGTLSAPGKRRKGKLLLFKRPLVLILGLVELSEWLLRM